MRSFLREPKPSVWVLPDGTCCVWCRDVLLAGGMTVDDLHEADPQVVTSEGDVERLARQGADTGAARST